MIGILDSGVGGLSVLREMRRCMPGRNFIYYGDTARGPYGQRSPETVASYLFQGLSRLADKGAGLLVVAGHSAAACLADHGMIRLSVPVLDIITHGVVPGLGPLASKAAVGIMGPPLLEAAGTHERAVRQAFPDARVFCLSAPLLEPLVDAGWQEKPETARIIKKYLHYLKVRQVDTLVLGSNHYSCLIRVIQRKIGKRVTIVDAAPVLAQGVKEYLAAQPGVDEGNPNGGTCRIMVSEVTPLIEKTAKIFYGQTVKIEQAG